MLGGGSQWCRTGEGQGSNWVKKKVNGQKRQIIENNACIMEGGQDDG